MKKTLRATVIVSSMLVVPVAALILGAAPAHAAPGDDCAATVSPATAGEPGTDGWVPDYPDPDE